MSFASKHNRNTKNLFTFQQAEDATYTKCKELYDHGYTEEKGRGITCRGFFISTGGRFGDSPVMMCDGFNVNLPGHMLQDVKDIMADPESVADINAGKVGAYVYEYTNSRGGKSYSLKWVDLPGLPGLDISSDDMPF